jgi:hypothetical protein
MAWGAAAAQHPAAAHFASARLELSDSAPERVTCTFVNPSYSGPCVETIAPEAGQTPAAACQPILECLNDARCAKTYCRSTSIRQGWTLKSAE